MLFFLLYYRKGEMDKGNFGSGGKGAGVSSAFPADGAYKKQPSTTYGQGAVSVIRYRLTSFHTSSKRGKMELAVFVQRGFPAVL